MPTITSTGLGSGLDVENLVTQLVAAERQPLQRRLDRREAQFQTSLSAMGTLKGALADFQSAVSGLDSLSAFQSLKTNVGNERLFTAAATAEAVAGTYRVEVQQLAQAQKLASKTFTDSSTSVGTGVLTFHFGAYDSDTNTFTTNADKSPQTVTIDTAHSSLAGIREAVNEVDLGVSASIVNDGTGERLVFTSKEMGTANSLQITVSDGDGDNVDEGGLSQLAYDPTTTGSGKNLTESVTAQDARLLVDGLTITRPTNTVSGVIEGVTLNLKTAKVGSPTTLQVAQDAQAATQSVKSFVDSYNDLVSTLNQLSSYDPETQQRGALLGDAGLRGIESQLRRLLSDTVTGLSGAYRTLADIGITTQRDGTLILEDSKLQGAIEADPETVARLFATDGRASDPLVRFVEGTDTTEVGEYGVRITQQATQGKYTGNSIVGFTPQGKQTGNSADTLTIDENNDQFTIKVDGNKTATITLDHESYSSGADLAAALQRQINGHNMLSEAGARVSVEFKTDHFEIRSNRYGSDSRIEILSLDSSPTPTTTETLGLTVKSGDVGMDVAGVIGGQSATGSGRFLTGNGEVEGLKLEVLGGMTGERGTVTFSHGIAAQLDTFLKQVLDSEGFLENRMEGLNHRIDALGEQREDLERRIGALEQRYRTQFTTLDSLLGQLQTTSDFLSQQIATLPGNNFR